MPLNTTQQRYVDSLVAPTSDISKINLLGDTAYTNYIAAKRKALETAYETYVTSGLPTDLQSFTDKVTAFSGLEANMASSLSINRKETLRDFHLVSHGYDEWIGTAKEKLSQFKSSAIITLNGAAQTLNGLNVNAFLDTNYINTLKNTVSPQNVLAQEQATAKAIQGNAAAEILTDTLNKVWEKKKGLFEETLGFKNWIS